MTAAAPRRPRKAKEQIVDIPIASVDTARWDIKGELSLSRLHPMVARC